MLFGCIANGLVHSAVWCGAFKSTVAISHHYDACDRMQDRMLDGSVIHCDCTIFLYRCMASTCMHTEQNAMLNIHGFYLLQESFDSTTDFRFLFRFAIVIYCGRREYVALFR